jgi:hypothetical protein
MILACGHLEIRTLPDSAVDFFLLALCFTLNA